MRCAGRVSPAKPLSPIRRSPLRYHVWTIAPRWSRIRFTPLEKKALLRRHRLFAGARTTTAHTRTHTYPGAYTSRVCETRYFYKVSVAISEFLMGFLVFRIVPLAVGLYS